jgi:hypothetical protein
MGGVGCWRAVYLTREGRLAGVIYRVTDDDIWIANTSVCSYTVELGIHFHFIGLSCLIGGDVSFTSTLVLSLATCEKDQEKLLGAHDQPSLGSLEDQFASKREYDILVAIWSLFPIRILTRNQAIKRAFSRHLLPSISLMR